jgi:1,4-alpha-glucan branching enzyme
MQDDAYLRPFLPVIARRMAHADQVESRITMGRGLEPFSQAHWYFGLHREPERWVLREWAPNATGISVISESTGWQENDEWRLTRTEGHGTWELSLPLDRLSHGMLYRLKVRWPGGAGDRIPSYARRVIQDPVTMIFNSQVWDPPVPYRWAHPTPAARSSPIIYECHVGMAQEREGIGTYDEFTETILPMIAGAGYNTVQVMAVMEHPYYGSFGYHVSSFFAASSRFGTPEEFKRLVDTAHGYGIRVIMDLVHSHAATNEVEGLASFDGTRHQYFHEGGRGEHPAWGSLCFDYAKPEVLHFLLSNCRYWLDEYHLDGFRFDGVTSMLYRHHGLGASFDAYERYFDDSVDEDALAYLIMANKLIHALRPDAVTVAEDVSGMPGLAAPQADGGCGFDYRLAMGVPDCWFRLAREVKDERWDMGMLWHELTNRRADEKTISYVESHDQALVGGKSMIFQMIDDAMYRSMRVADTDLRVDRGMALHKMMRLATIGTASFGYLNFMGNEFGHPEWIDFPREGNCWSCRYARRQWSLASDPNLKYRFLAQFDKELIALARDAAFIGRSLPRLLLASADMKVLAFERDGHIFVFNFHPERSLPGLLLEAPNGDYRHILDTDHPDFGGQGRIENGRIYSTKAVRDSTSIRFCLDVYLPCRTAMVMRRTENPAF